VGKKREAVNPWEEMARENTRRFDAIVIVPFMKEYMKMLFEADAEGFIHIGTKKYTNKHNLPPEVVSALLKDRYTTEGEAPSDFSASRLVAPVQQTILEKRYPEKLKVRDVIDDYWAFLGSIAHQVLEESWHASMGGIVEERLYMEVLGKTLSGKMDRYLEPEIRDYKTTKVYKIMKGDYEEWEKGQNIYAQLCREKGWKVESIKIIVLLTDWKKGEMYKKNYPQAPILEIPLRVWSEKEAIAYINHRAESLISGETLTDENLLEQYPCSSKEMWEDLKDYAVVKNEWVEGDRATKSAATEEEAIQYLGEKGWHATHQVIKRMTPRTRCNDWCDAAPVCLQYKKYKGEDENAEPPLF
jgi:hypothetical protein